MSATITVSRKELQDAVTFASLARSSRPVLPVLAGMRVTVTAGSLELAATDYDHAATVTVHGHGDGSAQVLANGGELADAVKSLPRGKNVTATLDVSGDALTITCEGTEASVSLLPLDEYPQLPQLPAQSGVMDGDSFARSIMRVARCAGTDDTLPALLCILMTSEHGALEMAATDRYRLAVDRPHWTGPDDITALIPAAILVKYAKAADKSGKVSLHFGDGFAGLSDGTRTLITHVNPGEFVKYRNLMPERDSLDTVILADAGTLHAAVDRARKLTGRGERMEFDVTEGMVTVTATRDGRPAGVQRIDAVTDGGDAPAGFCAAYLASALAGFDGPVWIGLKVNRFEARDGNPPVTTVTKPVLLWADDDTLTTLVMPLRTPGEA